MSGMLIPPVDAGSRRVLTPDALRPSETGSIACHMDAAWAGFDGERITTAPMPALNTRPLATSRAAQISPTAVAVCIRAGATGFRRSYRASARMDRAIPKTT